MATRAMWKAVVRLDDLRVPVKLYAAIEDRSIRFQLLHDQDMVRIRQRMMHPETEETVEFEQTRRGFEVSPNTFVMFEPEELDELVPEPSRDIEILGFIDADHIDPQWYDRPYWLGPDQDTEGYFALADALQSKDVQAIARWTMRNKEYVGAIRAEQGYLAAVTLRHQQEVITADQLQPPEGRELDEQERELATRLVGALEADFNASDYHDEYRERLRQLIEAKRKGEEIEVEPYEEEPATESLAESLKASLAGV